MNILIGLIPALFWGILRLGIFSVLPLRGKLGVRANKPVPRVHPDRCFSNHAFINWHAAGRHLVNGCGGIRRLGYRAG